MPEDKTKISTYGSYLVLSGSSGAYSLIIMVNLNNKNLRNKSNPYNNFGKSRIESYIKVDIEAQRC